MPHIDQPIPKRRDHFGKGSLKQAILSSLSHLLIEQVYFLILVHILKHFGNICICTRFTVFILQEISQNLHMKLSVKFLHLIKYSTISSIHKIIEFYVPKKNVLDQMYNSQVCWQSNLLRNQKQKIEKRQFSFTYLLLKEFSQQGHD